MRLLIVEDDVEAGAAMARGLAEAGYVCDIALDGESGLAAARGGGFDVMIVDRMLPKLDGVAMVETLRREGDQTPVLFLSALGEINHRVEGLKAGGDDYLVKPYAFAELTARVEALARRRETGSVQTVLRVGDLEMDLIGREVRRRGQEIDLQPREFRLLEFLMRHAGQSVTRTMLLEKVWEYHFDPQTNVIDVHISRLRSKIDKGFDRPMLQTVRGAGYRLDAERVRLPRLIRTTAFRLTLLFLALFAAAATAFLGYIYMATAGDAARAADAGIGREAQSLEAIYHDGGFDALNEAVIDRASSSKQFLYLVMTKGGAPVSGSIGASPIRPPPAHRVWKSFRLTMTDAEGQPAKRAARGLEERLSGGELLFVGADVAEAQSYVVKIVHALWGAGALVVVLGLAGGLFVARDVSRNIQALTGVIDAARLGDMSVRARVRGARDELDDLAQGLNEMLERLDRSIAGLRHAGEAIAHDLRSPLTRLRARMESALIEAEVGRGDPVVALRQALGDADGVLRTFGAVLAIAGLEAAARAPDQTVFDPAALAAGVAELYEPLCEEKHLAFSTALAAGLRLRANRDFLAQALANLLDNAVKYTPPGGSVRLVLKQREDGGVEFSVADDGPGVPAQQRARVAHRFVRLENSRNLPGVGLGLSLVSAVAGAHGGRLELADGDPHKDGEGFGLEARLILPPGVAS